jgi:hypothetical protein
MMEPASPLAAAMKSSTATLNNLFAMKACLGLFAALCWTACDRAASEKGEQARGTGPQTTNVLLATKPGGLQEAVSARVAARQHALLTTSPDANEVHRLMQEFATASDDRRQDILALLGASSAPDAWAFLTDQAATGSRATRLAALDALAMHAGGDPSPAILACLASDDVEIRALSATLLGRSAKDSTAWSAAALDPSPDVRVAYHAAIADASKDIRMHAARASLANGDPQLRLEGASVAGTARSKEAADLLIQLLHDPVAGDTAAEGLFYFFGRSFEDPFTAQTWWQSNKESFTEDLMAK